MVVKADRWLSVQTVTGEEFDAAKDLKDREFTVFAPWHMVERKVFVKRRGDGGEHRMVVTNTRSVHAAYFPGYIFVGLNEGQSIFRLRKSKSVIRVVSQGDRLMFVHGSVMQKLLGMAQWTGYVTPPEPVGIEEPKLKPGDVVMMQKGPFAGFPAEVERLDKSGQLFLSVRLFGRSTSVECFIGDVSGAGLDELPDASGSVAEQACSRGGVASAIA